MDEEVVSNPIGRPSKYTPELADEICSEIVLGFSLRTICKAETRPAVSTIFNWFRSYPEFLEQYEKAKTAQADTLAEELLDISDDGSNDWMEKFGKDGESVGWQLNSEHVQRSRLRVDTRKWIASKLKPKKYGEKITAEHTGAGGGPIQNETKISTTEEAAAFYSSLLKK